MVDAKLHCDLGGHLLIETTRPPKPTTIWHGLSERIVLWMVDMEQSIGAKHLLDCASIIVTAIVQ
jgi:hypothetical protein